ncbi:MAG: hypothetical protein ACRDRL_05350 [Sciscionella sp.]
MATHKTCDGCGCRETPDTPLNAIGLIEPRDYCAVCAPIAEEFVKQRDELHSRVAGVWQEGYAVLRRKFAENHPDMVLPDV